MEQRRKRSISNETRNSISEKISRKAQQVQNTKVVLLAIFMLVRVPTLAESPHGFSWIDTASHKTTMNAIRRALKPKPDTVIRRVGVLDGFAVVFTESTEDGWSVYNFSQASKKTEILVSGYRVKVMTWMGSDSRELGITYLDCWGCEAATLFTTIHFIKGAGWSARWPRPKSNSTFPQPGAVVSFGDAGAPYDDNEVDQVFAVIDQKSGLAAGGWFHSRNMTTGKISDEVTKYSVDAATGKDRIESLTGTSALHWQKEICDETRTLTKPRVGQNSKACREVLRTRRHP